MWLMLAAFVIFSSAQGRREFAIDYQNNSFIMDGKPFQYVSGSMHYFRCPRELWRDRLRKMRDAGLNVVSTYIEWSQHEKIPGEFDFSGDLNVIDFIKTAGEEDLYVIVRPGPYICAERDMGGLPPWLLSDPTIRLRTSDPRYTDPVEKWMDRLLTELSPYLYGNGGPIIMLQVENEYGSYPACDGKYLIWLRDLFLRHARGKAVLFTTDGAAPSYLKCGKIPGVYATVDFGTKYNVTYAFKTLRRTEPRGPLVNSEFYPGWLTHWGEPKPSVNSSDVVATLTEMLQKKANVNFYMFHGGTNFAFTAGANFDNKYQSDITSYDYDAPMTEAGDLTPKYHDIKKVISKFFPTRQRPQLYPDVTSKGDYGSITLQHIASLFTPKVRKLLGESANALYPPTFEALGSYFGYVLYETTLPDELSETSELKIFDVRDRAVVFQDNQRIATFSREHRHKGTNFSSRPLAKLGLLVENLGRINYGPYNNDTKGVSNVTVNDETLVNWNVTAFPLDSVKSLTTCDLDCLTPGGFRFYGAEFVLKTNETGEFLPDTFLDVSFLHKGVVFLNDHNLGRYWSSRGPQLSLYVPGVWLKKPPEVNTLIIFEEKSQKNSIDVRFVAQPIWTSETEPFVEQVK